jgi:hypothetical protein
MAGILCIVEKKTLGEATRHAATVEMIVALQPSLPDYYLTFTLARTSCQSAIGHETCEIAL